MARLRGVLTSDERWGGKQTRKACVRGGRGIREQCAATIVCIARDRTRWYVDTGYTGPERELDGYHEPNTTLGSMPRTRPPARPRPPPRASPPASSLASRRPRRRAVAAACGQSMFFPTHVFAHVADTSVPSTDINCLCTNTAVQQASLSCLQSTCSSDEVAAAVALQSQQCAASTFLLLLPLLPLTNMLRSPTVSGTSSVSSAASTDASSAESSATSALSSVLSSVASAALSAGSSISSRPNSATLMSRS